MKKFLSLVLSLLVVLCAAVYMAPPKVEAASTGLSLLELSLKFPHGKYWNGGNSDSYTSNPCTHHRRGCRYSGKCGCNSYIGKSIQCMGYAEKLGYDATGYNPRENEGGWKKYTSSSAINNLKPGDIVRYAVGNPGHSIYITGVNGNTVTFTDCNYDGKCGIRWGVTISKSTLKSLFIYMRSAPVANTATPRSKWIKTEAGWVYYNSKGALLKNAWQKDPYGWCYLGADGLMATNKWVKDTVGWCYVGDSGYIVKGKWVRDYTGWCYVDSNGYMVADRWVRDYKGWCYIDRTGHMATNRWAKDSSGWCFVDANGYMVTNKWVRDSGGWCYVNAGGHSIQNAWQQDSTQKWCYIDDSYHAVTNGWVQDGDNRYYLGADTYRLESVSQEIDGVLYEFDQNGICLNKAENPEETPENETPCSDICL